MTHPTEAAKAAEAVYRLSWAHKHCGLDYELVPQLTAIIQASNETYAAARTRELVEALGNIDSDLNNLSSDLWGMGSPGCGRRCDRIIERLRALLATHQPTKEA